MMPYAHREYEAMKSGFSLAMAGYNPSCSFLDQNGTERWHVPEFLSTHPTDSKRINRIQRIMPQVLTHYKGSGIQNTTATPIKTKADVPVEENTKEAKTSKDWTF